MRSLSACVCVAANNSPRAEPLDLEQTDTVDTLLAQDLLLSQTTGSERAASAAEATSDCGSTSRGPGGLPILPALSQSNQQRAQPLPCAWRWRALPAPARA